MHVRIRQRRESVVAIASVGEDATRFTDMLELMTAIEAKAGAIEALGRDERLPALMATIRSARLIIEMSARSAETARLLMPCANAALLHVRSELLPMGRALGGHTKHERDLRQPQAEVLAPSQPA